MKKYVKENKGIQEMLKIAKVLKIKFENPKFKEFNKQIKESN